LYKSSIKLIELCVNTNTRSYIRSKSMICYVWCA